MSDSECNPQNLLSASVPQNVIKKPKFHANQKSYDRHKKNIRNMKALIEIKAPIALTSNYLKPAKLAQDSLRLQDYTLENLDLLERINRIQRSNGKTDNYKPDACHRHSQLKAMIREIKKIEKANKLLAKRILNVGNEVETTKELEEHWKKSLKFMRQCSNSPLILPGLVQVNELEVATKYNRPLVYMDLAVKNSRPLGRVIIMLFAEYAPKTVIRFIDLCENHRDWPHNRKIPKENRQCLMGSVFHRIFPQLFLEAGCLKGQNIVEMSRRVEENFLVNHNCKGTLALTPLPDGRVNTQFTISLKPLKVLNGKRLAFGRIIKGLNILDVVECYGTKNGKPKKEVEIVNCGILKL